MTIDVVHTVDDELVAAIARLLPQLSTARLPDRDELADMLAQPGCTLFAARQADGGRIFGFLVLTMYRIPTGLQARIDDVVVDDAARGKGVGEALSRAAIARAREARAKNVTLTSRPSREAANRLYARLGFQPVHTNVYRLPLDDLR